MKETRHMVFISYHHDNDDCYRKRFEKIFGDIFINKSVQDGEYNEELSADYIKRLIREQKVTSSSVIVVLIGTDTYKRKHVDWEISAGLSNSGGRSGLIGILLPTYYKSVENCGLDTNKFNPKTIPLRLYDNYQTNYAKIYKWSTNKNYVKKWIDDAFKRKNNVSLKVDNSRLQFKRNR